MHPALDQSDRAQALLAWGGALCGGPIIPVVVLALNWGKPDSLARRQGKIATTMWVTLLVIYVPVVARMAFAGGPDGTFWTVWGVVVLVALAITITSVITVMRAPVANAVSRAGE